LRAGDDEAAMGGAAGGFEQEGFERGLAVGAVGAEVAEIPARRGSVRDGAVEGWVGGAIEGDGALGAVMGFQMAKGGAAGEGEIEIVDGDRGGVQIGAGAGIERRKGDGGVYIVEGQER
jgi:hypothetical protein